MRASKQSREGSPRHRWVVLCDFDGTVSRKDVGNRMFARFASSGWKDTVHDWIAGRISSRDCLRAECALARATRDEVARFVLSQRIDPHFKRFLHFCRCHDIPVIILSDGLDFYIDLILKKYGLEGLPRFANHLVFRGSNLVPSFPYFHQGCGSCGNCKGFHVRRYGQDGITTIYVGDGFSDRCAVKDADLVFAKRDLRRYCRQWGIAHTSYQDFGDVLRRIRALVEKAQPREGSSTEHDPSARGNAEKETSRSRRRMN
jgi:2-hydroxy-3-keto-5-methylthiopentenyl-1-phosphate phosphatase